MTRHYRDYSQNSIVLTNIPKDIRYIHIETELGIINIYYGTDMKGRRIESVGLIGNRLAGRKIVKVNQKKSQLVELKKRG